MATTLFSSVSCPSRTLDKSYTLYVPSLCRLSRNPFGRRLKFSGKRLNFCLKAEEKNESPSSSVAVEEPKEDGADNGKEDVNIEDGSGNAKNEGEAAGSEENEKGKLQEVDWKQDEAFKNFMGNPSIEAAIKLEKRRAERKLQELNRERSDNPFVSLFNNLVRANLSKEKERLEKAEESFKALDINKLKSCFGFDTFFATDVRRFGDGGIFIGNLRKPIEEVIPKLEKKLSEVAGREVVVWLMEEKTDDITKQACAVQPKSEIDLQFESTKLSTPWGYISSIALAVTTFGTVALTSGLFLKPDATIDDYLANFTPLFGGFLAILAVSEIATRVTAARYGVKLSPSFLVPSNWTGCLGVMNNYESLLPNKKALFDIPVARTASAYLTSLVLAISAFVADGSFNGGDNALYIRPQFFYNNPLLSFIQYVIGPYTDDLGNVVPYAVEGVGVPVDPLAFAGLLGMVVTTLNLLPCGRLEGGRIAQAMFGRSTANVLTLATALLLAIGGLSGSVLCLAWGLFATFFRGGEEVPAKDEITPLGDDRFAWAAGPVLMLLKFQKILFTIFPRFGAMAAVGMRFSAEKLDWNRRLIITASRTLLQFQGRGLDFRAFSSSASDISNQSRGRLPRFFSRTIPPHKGGFVRVEGDEFWHMTKVLRLNINDRVELFDGKGRLIEGRIGDIERGGVDFEALEDPKLVSPITTQWHVFAAFGTLKGGRADWLVEKCTELGASSVTPLLTKHSHSISENRVDRLQRVILAASKQCQRLHEMILKPPVEVSELLPIVAQSKLSFVAVAEATPILCALNSLKREPAGVMIIGPEGDFTNEELNAMMEAGAFAVGLGPHRLRVETATMSLLATLMLWSDSQESTNS